MYSDGSGRDGDVTAAATNLYWESGQRLGGVGIALTHHGELESLTTAAERLAKISITDTECKRKDLKQLQRRMELQSFNTGLDKLLLFIEFWPALQIGTFYRILNLKCPEVDP